jgi:PPK2 family polyphosphate:nucleotide phosphotransferase
MPRQAAKKSFRDLLKVPPASRVDLGRFDCGATFGRDKEGSADDLAHGLERLKNLQDRIFAEAKHPVLIVLQGIDAAGKDGTIRHVMDAFNPMGCPVTSFKVPTEQEAAHDYLWRVHQRTPARGEIAIFNRSHYEDVMVVRVHGFVPPAVWKKRYDQINDWERMLTDEGTTILKFFLAIDSDEQRKRQQERIDDPDKRWKFKRADLEERKLWDDYEAAFEDALTRCSTRWAPWYLIPANRNWFRNLAVAEIVADSLDDLKPEYPPGEPGIESITVV